MENKATNISFRRIQQLALPAIIAGISEPVLSSTDAAIVGNISGEGTVSLAAAGIVGGFLSAIIWILGQCLYLRMPMYASSMWIRGSDEDARGKKTVSRPEQVIDF